MLKLRTTKLVKLNLANRNSSLFSLMESGLYTNIKVNSVFLSSANPLAFVVSLSDITAVRRFHTSLMLKLPPIRVRP